MKKRILAILFFLPLFSFGQNSWIQKLYFQNLAPYLNHNDSLTGVTCIDIGADGDIYVLANHGKTNQQEIYKINPSGDSVKVRITVGDHGGLSSRFAYKLKATADSGCIVARTQFSQSGLPHYDGIVDKYASNGTLQWENFFLGGDESCDDVVEVGAEFYAAVGDSVIKFDQSGNILGYDSTMTMPLQLFGNNDMLVRSPSLGLARIDQSGNIIWSDNTSGNCGCPASYFYEFNGNTVSRIDLRDGSTVWSKSYPWQISDLDSTADGGFVASFGYSPNSIFGSVCSCAGPGTIFRADVFGDTLWSRTYDFPYYGLPRIKMQPSGNIITGGGFIFAQFNYLDCPRDYSSFIATLDSSGHGIMETTSIVWPGDANANQIVDFNDDALNVTIAWGSTGVPRDTIDWTGNLGGNSIVGIHSDIASDWSGSFASGLNYKHADFNGDGMIDINDINPYALIGGPVIPMIIPSWRLVNPETFNNSIADFNLLPESDTVPPGAEIKYFLTLGNSNIPVDSIYGLSFMVDCNYNLLTDTPDVSYPVSDMGIPGINVLGYDFHYNPFPPGQGVLISRIDHNNVYQLYDTIAEITMFAKPTISSVQTLNMTVTYLKALTYSESPLQFNSNISPVVIDPSANVGVEENIPELFSVYPNPADKEFTMHDSRITIKAIASVTLFNLMGEEVKTIQLDETDQSVSVFDLPDGFYTGRISSEKWTGSFSFIVQH